MDQKRESMCLYALPIGKKKKKDQLGSGEGLCSNLSPGSRLML